MGPCNSKRSEESPPTMDDTKSDHTQQETDTRLDLWDEVCTCQDASSMHMKWGDSAVPLPSPYNLYSGDSFPSIDSTQIQRKERMGRPRAIFVSFYYLWLHWESIPSDILFNSIVCIHGRRALLFPRYPEEFLAAKEWPLSQLNFTPEFLQFIQCKDMQGLVLWLRQSEEEQIITHQSRGNHSPSAISRSTMILSMRRSATTSNKQWEFKSNESDINMDKWNSVSLQLCSIIDPTTNSGYNGIKLNNKWWKRRDITELEYCNGATQICNELESCNGNYKAMAELFKQCNASLIPMIEFDIYQFNIEAIRFENSCDEMKSDPLLSCLEETLSEPEPQSFAPYPSTDDNTDDDGYDNIFYTDFGDIPDENGFVWTHNYNDYLNQ